MKATELKSESLKKEYTVVIPAADFEKKLMPKSTRLRKQPKFRASVRARLRKKC